MGRPTTQKRRSVLGRETGIQEAEWRDDGWLWLKHGQVPQLEVEVPGTRDEAKYWAEQRYDFAKGLHKDFQWLRTPETERIFEVKGNALRLYGRESLAPGSSRRWSPAGRRISPTTRKSPSISRPPTSGSSPASPAITRATISTT